MGSRRRIRRYACLFVLIPFHCIPLSTSSTSAHLQQESVCLRIPKAIKYMYLYAFTIPPPELVRWLHVASLCCWLSRWLTRVEDRRMQRFRNGIRFTRRQNRICSALVVVALTDFYSTNNNDNGNNNIHGAMSRSLNYLWDFGQWCCHQRECDGRTRSAAFNPGNALDWWVDNDDDDDNNMFPFLSQSLILLSQLKKRSHMVYHFAFLSLGWCGWLMPLITHSLCM